MDGIEIRFNLPPDITLPDLAKMAIEHRNTVSAYYPSGTARPNFKHASYSAGCENEDHVRRWMVNLLQHCATDYELMLQAKSGKTGFPEMYEDLKTMINDAAEELIQDMAIAGANSKLQ